jgi:hypothetical protein
LHGERATAKGRSRGANVTFAEYRILGMVVGDGKMEWGLYGRFFGNEYMEHHEERMMKRRRDVMSLKERRKQEKGAEDRKCSG